MAGFSSASPNTALLRLAAKERSAERHRLALDLGCGAGRNLVPLAEQGWEVVGIDDAVPMLLAAARRARERGVDARSHLVRARVDLLPVGESRCDLVVAHGIWNLARSGGEFRRAAAEAARVAKAGGALFVFTFSRSSLPPDALPVAGETFVFTGYSGQPQCFLTEAQLVSELEEVGYTPDASVPPHEINPREPGALPVCSAPVILEGTFRRRE